MILHNTYLFGNKTKEIINNHINNKNLNPFYIQLCYSAIHNPLQYPKTHWTKYSRRWGESNLWDTWFRLLTIARIEISLENENINKWGFIKYPGIGYHYLLKDK